MKFPLLIALFLSVLSVLGFALIVSVNPSQDTYVGEEHPTESYGSSTVMNLSNCQGTGYVAGKQYAYIRFPLPEDLTHENLQSSIIYIYQNATLKTTGGVTSIHRISWCNITSAWNESTTWNTKPTNSCPYPSYLFPIPYSSGATYPPYFYYLSDLGSYGTERTGLMTDYLNASIDLGYVDVGLLQNGGCYNWSIQSSETPNTAMKPKLEINYNPTAVLGSILNVNYPLEPKVNEVKPLTVTIKNNGNSTGTYVIGLSIGNFEYPYGWCNSNCGYQGGTTYKGSVWFAVSNLTANEIETFTLNYKFVSNFFEINKNYDVWVRVLDENLTLIDEAKYNNVISISEVGGLVRGEIIDVKYPNNVTINDIQNFKVTVKNTGTNKGNFIIGLSVGHFTAPNGWCNHNCYSGGIMINGSLYFGKLNIDSNGQETAITGFQFKDTFFEVNTTYDLWLTLRDDNLDVIDELQLNDVITVISEPIIPNIIIPAKAYLGSLLGISGDLALNLIAMLVTIVGSAIVGLKTKISIAFASTFLGLLSVFSIIGWLPIWIIVIISIITAFLMARYVNEHILSRGSG